MITRKDLQQIVKTRKKNSWENSLEESLKLKAKDGQFSCVFSDSYLNGLNIAKSEFVLFCEQRNLTYELDWCEGWIKAAISWN